MQRNLAQSLFEHGQVRTTLAKAKDLQPFAERLITLARKTRQGSITARRRIHRLLGDRSLVPEDHREAYEMMSDAKRRKSLRAPSGRRYRTGEAKGKLTFTGESVAHRLINTVAPKFDDREGGYTRVIRLADRRVGDHGELAIVQLVGDEAGPGALARPKKTARRKRADARYAAAIKASKGAGGRKRAEAVAEEALEPEASEEEGADQPDTPAEGDAPADAGEPSDESRE
jgi:large subunit ribosomal protein L17